MKNIVLKYLLFGFMLIMIFLPHVYLPWLQKKVPILQAKRLQGAYTETKKPNFWIKRWMNGEFQKGYEDYIKDRNEISPFMVRLKTQMDYSLFSKVSHENILLGSEGQFYTKQDCEAHVGIDFKGMSFFEEKLRKLKYIIDFYEEKGIPFLVFSPPNKPSVLNKTLPDFYRNYPKDSTNRAVFRELIKELAIPFLDFDFLIAMQDTSSYALFGQASLHWSHYAFAMAADSARAFIFEKTAVPLPKLQWRDSIIMKNELAGMDKEMIGGANFLWQPSMEAMPYPKIRYVSDSLTRKPKILSISDSFYLAWYEHDVHHGLFDGNSKFLYYHNELYPPQHENGNRLSAHDLDILHEIENSEIVIITIYESNLNKFAYNFIEKVHGLISQEEGK